MLEFKLWNSCFKSFLHHRPTNPISCRLVVSSWMYSQEAFIISYQNKICALGGLDHIFHPIILVGVNHYPLPLVLIVKSPYTQFSEWLTIGNFPYKGFKESFSVYILATKMSTPTPLGQLWVVIHYDNIYCLQNNMWATCELHISYNISHQNHIWSLSFQVCP